MASKTWSDDTPYDWLERNLKRLGGTMLASVIYDVILCVLSLFFRSWLLGLMGCPAPQDLFYFYLLPLLHLVFASFCILAWMDTKRNIVIVTGAIATRLLYALLAFVGVLVLGACPIWAIAGAGSLAWAIVHYVFLRLSDFGFWEVLSRAGNPPGARGQ